MRRSCNPVAEVVADCGARRCFSRSGRDTALAIWRSLSNQTPVSPLIWTPAVRQAGRRSRRGVRSPKASSPASTGRGYAVPQFENPSAAPATITAALEDGPLEGRSIEAEVVEGRPPKTIDVPGDDGSTCRYCLADWVQTGRSAVYAFLYRV